MTDKQRKARRLAQMLTWMCEELRPLFIRPIDKGGLGWVKVDCIRTAKMAMAFFRERGIPAEPLVLSCLTINQPLSRYLTEKKKSLSELTREEIMSVPGARIHRMGRLSTEEDAMLAGGWRGHMVLCVNQSRFLDLTIDSVNDPAAHFVSLKPFWLPLPSDVIHSLVKGDGELTVRAAGGEIINYKGDPTNKGYESLATWTEWHSVHDKVLARAQRLWRDRR